MTAYLTPAKQAEIAKQIRVPHKAGIALLLTEVTAAVAHDVAAGMDVDFDLEVAAAIVTADIPAGVAAAITAADIPGLVDDYLATVVAANVLELDQNTSPAYVEAEVQAIADKVDALIAALVAAGLMLPAA